MGCGCGMKFAGGARKTRRMNKKKSQKRRVNKTARK